MEFKNLTSLSITLIFCFAIYTATDIIKTYKLSSDNRYKEHTKLQIELIRIKPSVLSVNGEQIIFSPTSRFINGTWTSDFKYFKYKFDSLEQIPFHPYNLNQGN